MVYKKSRYRFIQYNMSPFKTRSIPARKSDMALSVSSSCAVKAAVARVVAAKGASKGRLRFPLPAPAL